MPARTPCGRDFCSICIDYTNATTGGMRWSPDPILRGYGQKDEEQERVRKWYFVTLEEVIEATGRSAP